MVTCESVSDLLEGAGGLAPIRVERSFVNSEEAVKAGLGTRASLDGRQELCDLIRLFKMQNRFRLCPSS